MCYKHQTCTTGFSKDNSTTLQYPKCWVVTTSGIAGLQGNSIKFNTTYCGTQILLLMDNFNLYSTIRYLSDGLETLHYYARENSTSIVTPGSVPGNV